MAFSSTAKNVAVDAIAANARYISLHSANPATNGANEITAIARVGTTWGTSANGTKTGSSVTLTVPAETSFSYWGVWTTTTGGTFYYGGTLPAENYVAAGTYTFTPSLTAQDVA